MKSLLKGWLGETMTNITTWVGLDNKTYHRLNNITLPKSKGLTTQIDHIIVSKFGIFVIETKNYQGWIFGAENQEQWTQVFQNGKKFQFYNPIRQNYGHIKTLSQLLALDLSYFYSIIWFGSGCEIKTKSELPDFVLNQGLLSYIKSKNKILFTDKEVAQIVEIIKNNKFDKGLTTYLMHKENVKNHIATKQNPPNCPKCQTKMVKRIAKDPKKANQAFWGCGRYPECRGARDLSD